MVYGNLIQQFDSEDYRQDDLGLGQWMYMKFSGCDNIVTWVICRYSPCVNKKKDLGTVYQQHCWHLINKLNDDTCPRTQFREDLLRKMKQWQKKGNNLYCSLMQMRTYIGDSRATVDGSTSSGNEGSDRRFHRQNSRRHIHPREHANRCHLGYQRCHSSQCVHDASWIWRRRPLPFLL
jgi:hypothetical protein